MSFAPENTPLAKPEALLRLPVGMTSPLWGFYAGAAVSGAAWWWMTRWTRPQNLEALFGKVAEVETVVEAEVVVLDAPVVEAAEQIAEAVVETAPEPVAEILEAAPEPAPEPEPAIEAVAEAEPILEAAIDPPVLSEPVGGEAAPVAPALVVEAVEAIEAAPEPAPAPKPRARKAAPKTNDLAD